MHPTLLYSVLCLLCCLYWTTEARNVLRNTVRNDKVEDSMFKCACSVWAELYDDSPYYSFGVIQTFKVNPTEGPASPECHHIRHQCRKECELRADLGATAENNTPLGLKLCEKFGINTPRRGAFLVSHARLEGQGCGIGANENEAFLARSESRDEILCCGHTTVTDGGQQVELFGWNPDCKGKEYILL